ncbi:MAG: UDP-N-acetylmuramate:L-alanyl-gamma-D-glutamyl-meso-diaminopimelate ligase [Gammaproteobacteria bacterium]|nr:UDP-N-acetylmuramate:L-alanyl-gamma-D-glutamyl-meso-diaminopimelate ligase [Gammaproteobacteria bacterium]
MNIHILGICGTFMGGIALIARSLGHRVSGSDSNVYPPMSTLLEEQGIRLADGYRTGHLEPAPDLVIIGNTMTRGNEMVEYILRERLPFTSGPQWLSENVLRRQHVLAVSGTHGKTTTTSMLAWILEKAGLEPGFLIGGVAENFNISARTGKGSYFVIEADEYDTAFFDKRSKFIHYFPDTLIINNLEFDHADIFPDLEAIKTQFRHLLRIIPETGLIISHHDDENIHDVLAAGTWCEVQTFSGAGSDWNIGNSSNDYSSFSVLKGGAACGQVDWPLIGKHNAENALAAIAAATHVGIEPAVSMAALGEFKNVKRRLQMLDQVNGITVYDDFAHHPTAIEATLTALRNRVGGARIHAILEPRSNTMKAGVHSNTLGPSLQAADYCYLYQSADVLWDMARCMQSDDERSTVFTSTDEIIDSVMKRSRPGDHILIMSNGGFENIHQRLLQRLQVR